MGVSRGRGRPTNWLDFQWGRGTGPLAQLPVTSASIGLVSATPIITSAVARIACRCSVPWHRIILHASERPLDSMHSPLLGVASTSARLLLIWLGSYVGDDRLWGSIASYEVFARFTAIYARPR